MKKFIPFLFFTSLLLLIISSFYIVFFKDFSRTQFGTSSLLTTAKGKFMGWKESYLPNVVFITVDNLRQDDLSIYGGTFSKTPQIDQLGNHAAVFTSTFHPTPLALPNISSFLTGLIPPNHGVRDNIHFSLLDKYVTLAEVFSSEGYETAAFLGSIGYSRRFGLDQGFDKYDDAPFGFGNVQHQLFPAKISAKKLTEKVDFEFGECVSGSKRD